MKRDELIEWVLIFLALGALWPWSILRYRNAWSLAALMLALIAMVWVFTRRLARLREKR